MKIKNFKYSKSNYENIDEDKKLNESTNKKMDIDEIMRQIGEFGRSQFLSLVILCLIMIPASYQTYLITFVGINPPWTCNLGSVECNKTGVFFANHEFYNKRCSMKRESWKFIKKKQFSIVTEWDLVCEKLAATYTVFTVIQVGDIIGSIAFGVASDKYGRKNILFLTWFGYLFISFAAAFVNNIWVFVTIQFINGIFKGGVFVILFVLINELLGPKYKIYSHFLWCAYTLGLCLLPVQAWLIQNWRIFIILVSAPYLILVVSYKFVPESVVWLHSKKRKNSAEKILFDIAKFNKKACFEIKLSSCSIDPDEDKKTSLKYVFTPWTVCLSTTLQVLIWFSIGLAYSGITLSSENLSGNLYRDFTIVSGIDIPAGLIVIFLSNRLGCRRTTLLANVFGGLTIMVLAFVPEIKKFSLLRIFLGVMGKFLVSLSSIVVYAWSSEIYPTAIRSQGIGVCSASYVVGSASAPWIGQFLGYINHILPYFIIGASLLISGVFCYFLPEGNRKSIVQPLKNDDLIL
nr:solute carrier family 22 member 15-like isoform X2 [Hydra vulgaris]